MAEEEGDDCYYECYEIGPTDKASAILPKFAAALSILGSSCIIAEVLVDHRQGKGKAVARILLAMGISDLFFSFGWFLGTWPSPAGTTNYVWGASGTTATCTFQGFIIQIGWMAVPLFNISLSLFYLLQIRYNWSERQLNRLEPWVHGIIWTLALGTAIAALPLTLFNNMWEMCWIESFPMECEDSFRHGTTTCERGDNAWIYALTFLVFPVWVCIILSIVFMGLIFVSVRAAERRTRMYSLGPSANSHQRQVGCQALWYIGAFFITYIPDTVGTLIYYIDDNLWFFWLDIFAYFFLPLQGFLNFIVFMRPRKNMKTRLGRFLRWMLCCGRVDRKALSCSSSKAVDEDTATHQGATVMSSQIRSNNISNGTASLHQPSIHNPDAKESDRVDQDPSKIVAGAKNEVSPRPA